MKRWRFESRRPARTLTSLGRAISGPQLRSEWLSPPRGCSRPGLLIAPHKPPRCQHLRPSLCPWPWPPTRGPWRWTSRKRQPSRWVAFSCERVRGLILAGMRSWKKLLPWLVRDGMGYVWGWSWLFSPPASLPGLRKHRWALPSEKSQPPACLPEVRIALTALNCNNHLFKCHFPLPHLSCLCPGTMAYSCLCASSACSLMMNDPLCGPGCQ